MRHLRTLIVLLGLTTTAVASAELRTYEVDAKYRQEVYSALRSVLNPGNEPQYASGRISMLPTGQLLIDTTPEIHEQVAAVLESISKYRVEATPRVTLRYWAVIGTRNPPPNQIVSGGTDVPEILADVLDELRRAHGDLSFRLYGNATLVSESGQNSDLSGETLNIRQLAYVQQSMLNVELSISFEYTVVTGQHQVAGDAQTNPFQTISHERQGVNLKTAIAPNEFVVIGENTIRSRDGVADGHDGTVFYIVQWPVAD